MYAMLAMNPTNDDVDVIYPVVAYNYDDMPPDSDRIALWKKLRASQDFNEFADNMEFQSLLGAAIRCGRSEFAEFSAYMCLAQWLLEPPLRQARQEIIDSTFKLYLPFPNMKTGSEKIDREVDRLRRCLTLVPHPLLRTTAIRCATHARMARGYELFDPTSKAGVDHLQLPDGWEPFGIVHSLAACDLPKNPISDLHIYVLSWGYMTITDSNVATEFANAVLKLRKQSGERVLRLLEKRWSETKTDHFALEPVLVDCVIRAAAMTAPVNDRLVMLDALIDWALRAQNMRINQLSPDVQAAARENKVKFGSVATPIIARAMQFLRRREAIINNDMRARLAKQSNVPGGTGVVSQTTTTSTTTTSSTATAASSTATRPSTPGPKALSGRGRGANPGRGPVKQVARGVAKPVAEPKVDEEARERERLAGWSVDQLVRYIDGPLAQKSQESSKAIDIEAVAKKLEAAGRSSDDADAESAKLNSGNADATFSVAETRMEHAEIRAVIVAGIRATADFMLADLQAMRKLADKFIKDFNDTPVDQLEKELTALQCEKDDSKIHDVAARDLFARIEHAMTDLRGRVRHEAAEQVLLDRFASGLSEALKVERVELGRSIGGSFYILGEKAPLARWPAIASAFHGRVLPLEHVYEGGIERRLRSDEALALYVTCGSQSGAEFCVSVHLWRRRPGQSTMPPSQEADLKMDTVNWYDTYIPCCVLHVRPG